MVQVGGAQLIGRAPEDEFVARYLDKTDILSQEQSCGRDLLDSTDILKESVDARRHLP